jgi:hypothetical protein
MALPRLGLYEHIARMQGAVANPAVPRGVDSRGKSSTHIERLERQAARRLPQKRIERLTVQIRQSEIRKSLGETRFDGPDDGRVTTEAGNQGPQSLAKVLGLLGQELGSERLHRGEAIVVRVVGSKNRSENAAADLMQDAKRAKDRRVG